MKKPFNKTNRNSPKPTSKRFDDKRAPRTNKDESFRPHKKRDDSSTFNRDGNTTESPRNFKSINSKGGENKYGNKNVSDRNRTYSKNSEVAAGKKMFNKGDVQNTNPEYKRPYKKAATHNPFLSESDQKPVSKFVKPYTERKPREDRKFTGERPQFNSEVKRPYTKSFNRDERPNNKPYNKQDSSDKKPFNRDEKTKKTFGRIDRSDNRFGGKEERRFDADKKKSLRPETKKPFAKYDKREETPRGNIEEGREKKQSIDNTEKPIRTKPDRYAKSRNGGRTYVKKNAPQFATKSEISENGTRLNKYLANSGVAARRKADEIIEQGLIKVNGEVVIAMGHKVMPGDVVTFKEKPVRQVNFIYILLNKPKDYLTTVTDDKGRNTVMDLIKDATTQRVYPVGRLDRNTTGLLLLTNDGDLAQKLSHPSNGAKKVYEVELNKDLSYSDLEKIAAGVELEDGLATVDAIDYAHPAMRNVLGIALHVGKNRIVRRIFESLSYEVERLDRTFYAGLTKKDLPRGRWRFLSEKEIIFLKHF